MDLSVSEIFLLIWAGAATIASAYYHSKFIYQNTVNISMIGVMTLVCRGKATIHESEEGIKVKYLGSETVEDTNS
jgi:hypothetical protein